VTANVAPEQCAKMQEATLRGDSCRGPAYQQHAGAPAPRHVPRGDAAAMRRRCSACAPTKCELPLADGEQQCVKDETRAAMQEAGVL